MCRYEAKEWRACNINSSLLQFPTHLDLYIYLDGMGEGYSRSSYSVNKPKVTCLRLITVFSVMVIGRSFITVKVPRIYLVPGMSGTREQVSRKGPWKRLRPPLRSWLWEANHCCLCLPVFLSSGAVVLAGSFVAAGTVFFLPPLAAPRPLSLFSALAGWSVGCLGGGI